MYAVGKGCRERVISWSRS